MAEENVGPDSGPIQAEFHEFMNQLAISLDEMLNGPGGAKARTDGKEIGFFLTTYYMSAPGRFNYISNSEKIDVRAMLKEITARIEARLQQAGNA